jgi:2-polyprenyl-6-methoxyphenol hydroxylase-like FAD-dependent oxidoreductase
VHSTTRALVFGPEEQFSRYLGCTIACYPLADRYGIGRTYKVYNEPGRQVLAYGTRAEGELLMLFLYQSAKPEHLPREQRLAHLREVFAGMGWLTQQFLSDVSPSENVFMDAVIQIQMPTWHQGRVALVGDACDCPTLISGQGASMAMGGAYLLARALHETADYQQAFHRYEQQMLASVQALKERPWNYQILCAWQSLGPVRSTNDDESGVATGVSWPAATPVWRTEPLASARGSPAPLGGSPARLSHQ